MSTCPTCGRPLATAEAPCPHCTDPESTRMATGRRADAPPPAPESVQAPPPERAPYQQPPAPSAPQYGQPQHQPPQYGQPQYGQQQEYAQAPYGQQQYPPQYGQGQPPSFGQPLGPAPSRGPLGRGRLVAMVGGGVAMLVVIGLGAWAVTGMGSDDEPEAQSASESSTPTPTEEESSSPSPSPSATTEPATEPTPTAEPDQGAGEETSTTYDLASGAQSVDLTIVVDGPTTVTATPDEPEDIVLEVMGPRGNEACRSDSSFVEPESCTLRNPQVGEVYEIVVSAYGDVPGGTGTVEVE